MFKIIGADQKEYGPVSVEQIRQWINDGRLSAVTRAQRATGGDWQPLSSFAEFADLFQPTGAPSAPTAAPATPFTPGTPIPTASREMALSAVKGPAVALIVVAAIGVAICFMAGVVVLLGMSHNIGPEMPGGPGFRNVMFLKRGVAGLLQCLLGAAVNGAVLFGAIRMQRLQGHTLSIVTCILAMLPCSGCCLFGLPFGIWGLVVLNKPEVKSQFTN